MPNKWMDKQQKLEAEEARRIVEYEETQTFDNAKYKSQFKPPEFRPGDPYVWQDGDQLHDIARRMNVKLERLMQYNEVQDYNELEPGVTIYAPVNKSGPKRLIQYKVLPEPREMHISKPRGAKKWSFGNVRTWEDFKQFGFYPSGTPVSVVAVARVPVDDPDDPNAQAGYYLDSLALGDYSQTGKVRYTVGYAWSDLEDGQVETTAPKPEPQQVMDVADTKKAQEQVNYKSTYQGQTTPIPCIATLPNNLDFIWVKEFDERRPNRKLLQHQEVSIAGIFQVNESSYGRPEAAAKHGYWFGIPMEVLQKQEDMYNPQVDVADRAAVGGKLTLSERFIDVPLAKIIYRPRYSWLQKLKNKNKEQ